MSGSEASGEETRNVSDAHMRGSLDYAQYCNSKTMSDITITYGLHGEKTFYGHKIILARQSHWFKAAFTGNFDESTSKELTLHDDDSNALSALFDFIYGVNGQKLKSAWDGETIENDALKVTGEDVQYYLGVWQVADKYDVPRLVEITEAKYTTALDEYFHILPFGDEGEKKADQFGDIIQKVYELNGGNGRSKLLEILILKGVEMTGFQDSTGMLKGLLDTATAKHPQYGRDILLHLVNMQKGPEHFHLCRVVGCLNCMKEFLWEDDGEYEFRCSRCGNLNSRDPSV